MKRTGVAASYKEASSSVHFTFIGLQSFMERIIQMYNLLNFFAQPLLDLPHVCKNLDMPSKITIVAFCAAGMHNYISGETFSML